MTIRNDLPVIDLVRPKGRFAGLQVRAEAEPSDPEKTLKLLTAQMKEITDGLKSLAEESQKSIKATGDVTLEVKAKSDELLAKQSEIEGRMTQVEQVLTRRPSDAAQPMSLGQTVIEDDNVKAFMKDKPRGSVKVPIKAAITSGAASGGDLVVPQRQPGIVTPPQRAMRIRDLLMPGRTNSNSVEYVRETGFTNAAAPTAENTVKPESDITFTEQAASVRTIAHWVQATKQILDDAPMLQSYIDGRLRYGLELVEETQILTGDGLGQNLHGLIPQATAYAPAFAPANETMIDKLRLAFLQVILAEYPADAVVLHPTDWARIELTKDTQGRYIFANPQGVAGPVMWGRPVVESQSMVEDEFLTGAFSLGAQLFDREDANVQVSTEDRDNFVKNMVTIRGEERVVLVVYRPESFIHGDFGNIPPTP